MVKLHLLTKILDCTVLEVNKGDLFTTTTRTWLPQRLTKDLSRESRGCNLFSKAKAKKALGLYRKITARIQDARHGIHAGE